MAGRPEIRYSKNPFVSGDNLEIRRKKKWIKIGTGKDVLLDFDTGEMTTTNVVSVKEVDNEQFVKLFTQNIGLMMGFNAAGIKALGFLIWGVQGIKNRDIIQLDNYTREEFLLENKELIFSERTMYQGLKQLEEGRIIAKAKKYGFYFINPNFIFNGDRVRFITEIRRKSKDTIKREKLEAQGQQRLFEGAED